MAFRTKKISQMDPKGANLASTDLLEISQLVSGSYVTKSITGAEIVASVPPSVTTWGTITGTLSAQTDLNTALSGKVPTSRTLTINGTTQDLSADRTFTISTGITIGTTAITSGTVGRVLFEGTGNVVQESANLFWDNTNVRLGVGTSSPSVGLDVRNGFNLYTPTTNHYLEATSASSIDGTLNFRRNGGANGFLRFSLGNTLQLNSNNGSGECQIATSTGGFFLTFLSNGVEAMRIPSATRNVLINTTTDAGFKLDVNGTARATQFFSGASNYADSIGVGISVDGANFSNSVNASSANMLLLKGSSRFAYTTAVGAVYYFCGRYSGGASTWIPTDFMKLQLSGSEMWGIASGTATSNAININLNLNFTGGTSTVRGIYYNPTLTSMTGVTHYAFHSTSGRHRYENLPTSPTGLASGDLWNNLGVLQIV
jgi:hypothetical protein